MTNNDVLRRLRYCFDLSDSKMIEIFKLANHDVSRAEVSDWLKSEEDPDFKNCSDKNLAMFLNGFITHNRGPKEGSSPEVEARINNNIIFNKLKIALNLKAEEILAILELVEFGLSKHELSAFFRRPDHKHYRECHDQILRNFLNGMQIKYRDDGTMATS